MKVVVTGAGGHFARALIPMLLEHPDITEIVGIDAHPPSLVLPRVEYHQADVRSRRLAKMLAGADVLIHLAFVIYHRGKRQTAEEVNLDGTIQVLEMAARQGIKRIVAASSHAVYGAHPDNPVPIDEVWPRRGNRQLHYSWAKRVIEEYLDTFELRYPDVEVVRLRPCNVWGPNVPPSRAQLYLSSVALAAKRYDAPIQLLHEADVARAFVLAAAVPEVSGAFNIAPRDWIRPSDLRGRLQIKGVHLPGLAVKLVSNVMWKLSLTEISPEWLLLGEFPIVLSSKKVRRQLGWEPTRTTVECARETVGVIRGESPVLV